MNSSLGRSALVFASILGTSSAFAEVRYSSIPDKLPGNVASVGFEATSTSEFGDHVRFIDKGKNDIKKVTVVVSSWGCEAGGWNTGDCVTKPGAKFSMPITLNIYAVDNTGAQPAVGALLATRTQTFKIAYRPSSDAACTGGRWYDKHDKVCYRGFADEIEFDLGSLHLKDLPDEVIWGVAYNTSHHGYAPVGEATACYTSSGGCGYDSLNIGADTIPNLIGTDVDPTSAFINTTPGFYCDGGPGGTFRGDYGCTPANDWSLNRPMVEFKK